MSFSGLKVMNWIELKAEHRVFLRQEKEGTKPVRNELTNIFYSSPYSVPQLSSSPTQAMRISGSSLTTQPPCSSPLLVPASLLTTAERGATAHGHRSAALSRPEHHDNCLTLEHPMHKPTPNYAVQCLYLPSPSLVKEPATSRVGNCRCLSASGRCHPKLF